MEYFEIKILYSLLEFIKFKGTAVIFTTVTFINNDEDIVVFRSKRD